MMRMRAVAVTSPRTTGNHPATALPSPPSHSSQEQPATVAGTADAAANSSANTTGTSTVVIAAHNILPALPPCKPVGLAISQASSLPQAQLSPSLAAASITTAHPVSAGDESTTQASQTVQDPSGGSTTANTAATSTVVEQKDDVPAPTRRTSVSSGGGPGAAAAAAAAAAVPTTPDESGSSTGTNAGAGSGTGTATGNGSHVNQVGTERRHRALPVAEFLASCARFWEGNETRTEWESAGDAPLLLQRVPPGRPRPGRFRPRRRLRRLLLLQVLLPLLLQLLHRLHRLAPRYVPSIPPRWTADVKCN